jgi:hypothetical protein
MVRQNDSNSLQPVLTTHAYDGVAQRVHALAEKALRCLEELYTLYPSELSREAIEAVRRFHSGRAEAGVCPGGQERRRAPRFPAHGHKLLLMEAKAPREAWEVVEVDHSWNGLAFLSDRPVKCGSVVTVWDAGGARAGAPEFAEVKSCRPDGGGWAVGCELLPPVGREEQK